VPQSFSHVQDLQGMATGTGISPGQGPAPLIRDAMEAARLAWRREPSAEYPSGYLGTTTGRRQDRLSTAIWRNQKSYNRGVHKGERIDMSDYLWPEEFNLETGLMMQAGGSRFTSMAYSEEPVTLTNDGRPGPRDEAGMMGRPNTGVPVQPDPQRAAQLKHMRPTWR
jgi:hypothetical protein